MEVVEQRSTLATQGLVLDVVSWVIGRGMSLSFSALKSALVTLKFKGMSDSWTVSAVSE